MSSFVLGVLYFTYSRIKFGRLLNIPSGRDIIAFDAKRLLVYGIYTYVVKKIILN